MDFVNAMFVLDQNKVRHLIYMNKVDTIFVAFIFEIYMFVCFLHFQLFIYYSNPVEKNDCLLFK